MEQYEYVAELEDFERNGNSGGPLETLKTREDGRGSMLLSLFLLNLMHRMMRLERLLGNVWSYCTAFGYSTHTCQILVLKCACFNFSMLLL